MREYVGVTWIRFRYAKLCISGGAQDGYVHAVTYWQRLKYIGLAYQQTAAKRISKKNHIQKKYAAILQKIHVWVGQVNVAKNSFSYLTKSRI